MTLVSFVLLSLPGAKESAPMRLMLTMGWAKVMSSHNVSLGAGPLT